MIQFEPEQLKQGMMGRQSEKKKEGRRFENRYDPEID